MKTLDEQIDSAKREVAMRKRVYARKVADGSMREEQAQHEQQCMEAIVGSLHELKRLKGESLI